MRTTKKERKENAKKFYNMFMNSSCNKDYLQFDVLEKL